MASKIECPRCGRLSASLVHGVCRACYMRDYHQRRSAAAVTQCPRCGGLSANFTQGVCRACYMRDYQQRRSAAAVRNKQTVLESPTLIDESEGQRLCVECKAPGIYARGLCLNCYMRDRQRLHRERFCVECGAQSVYSRGLCRNCFALDSQRRQHQRSCVECRATGTYARGLCQKCYLRDLRRHRRMKHRACVVCGVSFLSARRDALYCSPSCCQKAHRAGNTRLFPKAAHVGERGAVQSAIGMQDAALAALADLDQRQIEPTIEEVAKCGRTDTALSAIDGQREVSQVLAGERQWKASTLADLIPERATLGGDGRQIEAEAAPVRYVAEPIGADTDSEWGIRWFLALIMLYCDPPARAPTAAASARNRPQSGGRVADVSVAPG
jgi:hypothetical protein